MSLLDDELRRNHSEFLVCLRAATSERNADRKDMGIAKYFDMRAQNSAAGRKDKNNWNS
jgi:hypothetical protein